MNDRRWTRPPSMPTTAAPSIPSRRLRPSAMAKATRVPPAHSARCANELRQILSIAKKFPASVSYPRTGLGDSLSLVGRMIAGGLATRVYYVSQGGYDTHTTRSHPHPLMANSTTLLSPSPGHDLPGQLRRVMLMTFSEFGRRSPKTPATAPITAPPPHVRHGRWSKGRPFWQVPQPQRPQCRRLAYNVDFRSVYATILDRWLRAPARKSSAASSRS